MMDTTIVGLDLSLTGAGVATIQPADLGNLAEGLRRYGVHTFGRKGSKSESLDARRRRIHTLIMQIRDVVMSLDSTPDLALIESPATSQTTGHSHDRSGLWWGVVEMLYQLGIPTIEVGISKVKIYALGKGVGAKDEVMAAVIRRYTEVPVTNNNESDAFVLAAIGARLLGDPVERTMAGQYLNAMKGLERP